MREKCILGLNVGITSVGWAVVDLDKRDIMDAGVRMFPCADATHNQIRKNYRGARRNTRRRRNRLNRLDDFLKEYGITKPTEMLDSPLELRIKGLQKKLNKSEIYVVLYHLTKYRGISDVEDMVEFETYDENIKNNRQSKLKYPCEIQKYRLENYGVFRGINKVDDHIFNNTFSTTMYEKEVIDILKNQEKFYKELDIYFLTDFIKIFRSKREYYEGPGNEKSRTNYGIYKTDGTTLEYLYDEFRGACSIFHGKYGVEKEMRASSASYKVQYYNVLNDLCNIKVDGNKLSHAQKIEIITLLKRYKLATTITKALRKLYGIEGERVTGYRVDKRGKETNHCFETYRYMRRFLEKEGMNIEELSGDTLDTIADILTLNADTEGIFKHFNNKERDEYHLVNTLTSKEIESFIKLKLKRKELFSKWSSFSYKLLDIIIPEMLTSGDEQFTCIRRLGLQKYDSLPRKNIDYRNIVDEIYNPSVSRAVIQSIKIVNRLINQYNIVEIIVEMPRDNSFEEEKTKITKLQKKNESQMKLALAFAGINNCQIDTRKDRRMAQKIKLYYQQRGRCLYSGRKIILSELLEGSHAYEVDHIVPLSRSFDDSMSNKVLVEANQNQKKSNMTPYQYLNNYSNNWGYNDYKTYVLGLRRDSLINNAKKENLLLEKDINKQEVIRGYIERNTNDTRYASKIVGGELERFFVNNNKDVKVKIINSAITSQLKNRIFGNQRYWKNDYKNYAKNAMICCYTGLSLRYYNKQCINIETGEVLAKEVLESLDKDEQAAYLPYSNWEIKTKVIKFTDKIKISHKIDTKVNRLISDQTIYGTRQVDGEYYTIHKIKNIYDDKEYDRLKKKLINDKGKFLMFRNDTKSWEKLEDIISMYPKASGSPFKEHLDKVGPLTKYSKNGNGPVIKELKYLGHRIGKGVDITHKYVGTKNKVVMESLKQFRGDVYYDHRQKCYNIVPVRYMDFSIRNKQYIMDDETYENLLRNEKLIGVDERINDLPENGHEFCFSLYRNNIIGIVEREDDDRDKEIKYIRYQGKNHSLKNRFEYKRIDGLDESRKYITFSYKIEKCYKYNVDILGNYYKVEKESLKMSYPLVNRMRG